LNDQKLKALQGREFHFKNQLKFNPSNKRIKKNLMKTQNEIFVLRDEGI